VRWLIPTSRHRLLLGYASGYFSSAPSSLGVWSSDTARDVALVMTAPPRPADFAQLSTSGTDFPVLLEVRNIGSLPAARFATGNAAVAALEGWLPAAAVTAVHVASTHEQDEILARRYADIGDRTIPLSARPDLFGGEGWHTDIDAALSHLPPVTRPTTTDLPAFEAFEAAAAFVGALRHLQPSPATAEVLEAVGIAWAEPGLDDPVAFIVEASRNLAGDNGGEGLTDLIVPALVDQSPSPDPDGEGLAGAFAEMHPENSAWTSALVRIHEVVGDITADVEIKDPSAQRELQALLLLLLRPSPRGACGANWPDVNVDERTLALADCWSHLLAGRLPTSEKLDAEQARRVLVPLVNHLNRAAKARLPEFA